MSPAKFILTALSLVLLAFQVFAFGHIVELSQGLGESDPKSVAWAICLTLAAAVSMGGIVIGLRSKVRGVVGWAVVALIGIIIFESGVIAHNLGHLSPPNKKEVSP